MLIHSSTAQIEYHISFPSNLNLSASNTNFNHLLNLNQEKGQVMLAFWCYSTMIQNTVNIASLKCLELLPNGPIIWNFSNWLTNKNHPWDLISSPNVRISYLFPQREEGTFRHKFTLAIVFYHNNIHEHRRTIIKIMWNLGLTYNLHLVIQ